MLGRISQKADTSRLSRQDTAKIKGFCTYAPIKKGVAELVTCICRGFLRNVACRHPRISAGQEKKPPRKQF